jgi:hypothetical protein
MDPPASSAQLPIRQHAAEILKAVQDNDVVVVIGETGSGKTTQLSQVSLDHISTAVITSHRECYHCWRCLQGRFACADTPGGWLWAARHHWRHTASQSGEQQHLLAGWLCSSGQSVS